MDAPHATITILDVSLSLVHIPRSRVADLNRPILKQLLRRNPKFLNLTANELELSIFVENDALEEFEEVARKDRQKLRCRELAATGPTFRRHKRMGTFRPALQPVEVSFDKWRVLQIDSHEDALSNSGSRVRELSAPLAEAGISILYQSSYQSDFIFVKTTRLGTVMELLDAVGFTFYNADTSLFSQNDAKELNRLARLNMEATGYGLRMQESSGTMSPAVLSRTRSPSLASIAALSYALSRNATLADTRSLQHVRGEAPSSPHTDRSKKSMSPASAPVDVLRPDIACVGLNDAAVDSWSMKILTLIGYPELIPTSTGLSPESYSHEAYENHTHTLYDLAPNDPRIRSASPESITMSRDIGFDGALKDISPSARHVRRRNDCYNNDADDGSLQELVSSSASASSYSDSDGEDQYFSSPSPYNKRHSIRESSMESDSSRASARSLPDRLDPHLAFGTVSQSMIATATDDFPSPSPQSELVATSKATSSSKAAKESREENALRVPFFSFTRTAEGSSLTTDLKIVSALFQPDERHMLICSDSLLEIGDTLNEQDRGESQARDRPRRMMFDLGDEADLEEEKDVDAPGLMKCLQIDLHRYGLEKHGLVNRFSGVLDKNGINHMYSSTFKTANLLVEKGDAFLAQKLLRNC